MIYTMVRIVDSGGRPQSGIKVSIFVSQFLASGFRPEQYTNTDGEAEFSLDIDNGAELTIYANGQEKISKGPVRADYRVII